MINENIKNCVILSQTYYYLKEDDNKVFAFEFIKDNKIFKNTRLWRNFIDDSLSKEFQRFEDLFPDSDITFKNNEKIPKKTKEKLNEIVFAQLLTYISNIKDFGIDERVLLKILDEFTEKYPFLSDNNLHSIYQIITQDKYDIDTLRKEYDPSLEEESSLDKPVWD